MKNRCQNKNHESFARYGGRGIFVCERWESFENFLFDMGEKPFPGAEIDRINNNGPYSPENCAWSTRITNSRNRSTGRIISTPAGDMPLWKAAEVSGLSSHLIAKRIDVFGWPADRLFDERGKRGNNRK